MNHLSELYEIIFVSSIQIQKHCELELEHEIELASSQSSYLEGSCWFQIYLIFVDRDVKRARLAHNQIETGQSKLRIGTNHS